MANKAPEVLSLHLAELTATQFLDIWNKFDTDGECIVPGQVTVEETHDKTYLHVICTWHRYHINNDIILVN